MGVSWRLPMFGSKITLPKTMIVPVKINISNGMRNCLEIMTWATPGALDDRYHHLVW